MLWLFIWMTIALTAWMTLAWATQRAVRNAGWVDVFWTFGTGVAGVVGALAPIGHAASGITGRQYLVAAMVAAWSLRLGGYIALRVATSPNEDVRYQRFRREWGADFQSRFARFVIVQGPIAAIMALAVMVAARNPAPFPSLADAAGLALLLAGVSAETVADRQMRRFRKTRGGGQVCDVGLWSLSRHPNYFGEFVVWWAYPAIALGADSLSWWPGWLAVPALAMIYWLLVHVSGVPPLEREMRESRGAAFADYQRRVPAFFPLRFAQKK